MTSQQPDPGSHDRPIATVFDIDGVLSDARHRVHFVTRRPKDWDGFFAAAVSDPPLPEGVQMVAQAVARGHEIVYVTGRPERCRADTVTWLAANGLPAGPLHMRRDDDRRPARFTKLAALRRLSRTVRVHSFVDDDAAVVAVIRAAGFQVVHATWMESSTSGVDAAPGASAVLTQIQQSEGRF